MMQKFHFVRLNGDFSQAFHDVQVTPSIRAGSSRGSSGRRRIAHARAVEDRLARPSVRVAPERAHAVLRIDVGLVIGEQEEPAR